MTVKERVTAIHLAKKVRDNPDYAKKIGIVATEKWVKSNVKTHK